MWPNLADLSNTWHDNTKRRHCVWLKEKGIGFNMWRQKLQLHTHSSIDSKLTLHFRLSLLQVNLKQNSLIKSKLVLYPSHALLGALTNLIQRTYAIISSTLYTVWNPNFRCQTIAFHTQPEPSLRRSIVSVLVETTSFISINFRIVSFKLSICTTYLCFGSQVLGESKKLGP